MLQILKRNPMAALIAVLMHLVIILFMVVGVDWLEKPQQPKSNVEVVQARVIDQSKVVEEAQRLKQADDEKKQQQAAQKREEEQRLEALKKQQQDEKQRLAELEQKRQAEEQAEAKRQAEIKRKTEQEKKKLAELEKKRQAEQKKAEQAEAKRKAEEQKRKEQEAERIAAEKKRKAEEAKRRIDEQKRKAAEAKKLAEEEARKAREAELLAAQEAERNAREMDRFSLQIRQKVNRTWVRPAGIGEGLKCTLRVRLAPGGAVLAVSVVKSSGNDAFDRSASAAVYKADPLPVPSDSLFEKFRDITFEFNPS
ncbi:MAG: cell envelope integrity protein TolA [Sedimenticola sp.]|nr:MAG: cell envelope integrity protein TolA [Sedimenticola sp.]